MTSLLGLAALAWVWLYFDAGRMQSMQIAAEGMRIAGGAMGPAGSSWRVDSLLLVFLMWAIMMVGMMLPSAMPAILLYGTMARKHRTSGAVLPSVWIFTAGYLLVWTLFSGTATLLQAGLTSGGLLTPMMASSSAPLTGGLLIAAGLYQWLPLKEVCLEKCRAPLQFFMFRWRRGRLGTLAMGIEHGAFCVGCCWALMLLLFAAGVMNLIWVALIASFVLFEKLMPGGRIAGRLAGIALVIAGVVLGASA